MATFTDRCKQAALPLGILVLGIALAGWFVASRPQAMVKPPQEKVWPVSVVRAVASDQQPQIVAFGEVRAAREAEIRAMVAGRLVELDSDFQDGNLLAAGQQLAIIDPADYENREAQQRAELAQVSALLAEYERELKWEIELRENALRQVTLARRSLERSEQLASSGRESQKVRDDTEAALASTQQLLLQREQTIGRLRARVAQQQAAYEKAQAALANAERELARTRIVAPFDGYVTDVQLALGKRVAVGEALGRLLSASELEVRFELPEADFARLLGSVDDTEGAATTALVGRELKVIWRLGDAEQQFPARLARFGAEIDPTLGGIELIASIDAVALRQGLRAGAFVEVHLPDVVYREVYRLPAAALSDDGSIYVLRDQRLVEIAATVVRTLGADVLVRAALQDNEAVVASTFAGIGPGLRARAL